MTTNQIEYAKLLENRRIADVQNELTRIRDANTFELGKLNLNETERANRAREAYNINYLTEISRANLTREAQNQQSIDETRRANAVREALSGAELEENKRANLAREAELYRSHTASESISERQLQLDQWYKSNNIDLGYANIGLGYANLGEQKRSHLATENELHRANVARETEAKRANEASEQLKAYQALNQKRYQEEQLLELNRANIARETETNRSNQRNEQLQQQRNYISMWDEGVRTFNALENLYDDVQNNLYRGVSILGGLFHGQESYSLPRLRP